jgi:hypothetical protein
MFTYTTYFYKLDTPEKHNCRKYLHIKSDGYDILKPDLTLIMLNPGSCKGYEAEYGREIKAIPDPTLHRVRSLMEFKKLNWIQVLNLTDLQDANSDSLFRKLKVLSNSGINNHSIFDISRREELATYLHKNNKVYFACGVNRKGLSMLENAKAALADVGGCVISGDNFYHPLVRPRLNIPNWRDQAAELIDKFL